MRPGFVLVAAVACSAVETPASPRGIGLAVVDSAGAWCAELPADSVSAIPSGTAATIILVADSGSVSLPVRVTAARSTPCGTAFPQPRWSSYTSFSLERKDSVLAASIVGLIALGEIRVTNASGETLADVDGDGMAERIRRCAADEGEHFTVWRGGAAAPVRRWHEYFDWGAIVDPTCKPGEDGRDGSR